MKFHPMFDSSDDVDVRYCGDKTWMVSWTVVKGLEDSEHPIKWNRNKLIKIGIQDFRFYLTDRGPKMTLTLENTRTCKNFN
jgi:hypothetical protein